MVKTDFQSVDEYIASQPETVREVLERVRSAIRKALPGAEEVISYQIPAFKLHGGPVLYLLGGGSTTRFTPLAITWSPRSRTTHAVPDSQSHDPFPSLAARPRTVDRTHREVSREGSSHARKSNSG
jgi:Uncharacterized conserved protein